MSAGAGAPTRGGDGRMSAPSGSPLRLRRRVERAGEGLAAILVTLLVGMLGALVIGVLMLGVTLSLVWIGLPLVIAALGACQALAEAHRRQANRLLGAHLPPLPPPERRGDTLWRRSVNALSDRRRWRVIGLVALDLPVGAVLLAVGLAPIVLTAELLVMGVSGIAGVGEPDYVGPMALEAPTGVLLLLLALACAVLAVAVLGALRVALRAYTRALLGHRAPQEGPIRELLAERMGDRTLSIAYWLADRETFVDEFGRQVEMPAPGSGRTWTAVEHDGRRVAAIVHDAELDATPELVNAAAAAAALALDNERLKADLRARVEDLRISRARIVEAADTARRRLERDLHDGAQQQLVSLALDLRILRARLKGSDAVSLVDEISDKLGVALAELRELARGIHPAILTDRGLGPAVQGLADRVPLPVECAVDLPERPSPPIEAAAYFVVAEALTNVARYAKAGEARVEIRRAGDDVVVTVEDDGVGGADADAGTGLRGLQDRLAALDGVLTIESPRGEGTRLRAVIPCAASTLVAEAKESDRPPMAASELEPRR
jgi:signal transduction histidine kinase